MAFPNDGRFPGKTQPKYFDKAARPASISASHSPPSQHNLPRVAANVDGLRHPAIQWPPGPHPATQGDKHPEASRRNLPPPRPDRERDDRSASPPRLQAPHTGSAHTGRSSSISGLHARDYDTRPDAPLLPPLSSLHLPRPPPQHPIPSNAYAAPVRRDYDHNLQPSRTTDRRHLNAPGAAQHGHNERRGPTVPASERPTVTLPPIQALIAITERRGPPAQTALRVAAPPPVVAPPLPLPPPPLPVAVRRNITPAPPVAGPSSSRERTILPAPPVSTTEKQPGGFGGKKTWGWTGLARLDRNLCVHADGVWHCPEPNCPKVYVRFNRLEDHHRKAHGDKKPYRCTFDPSCTAGFATKDELAAHIQSHPLVGWLVCGCGYPYMREKSLQHHRDRSTNPRCKEF